MSTPFSAGPQGLGYYYQARHALYAIIQDEREEVSIIIEGLDDVVTQHSGGMTLDQLKHHINRTATLTLSSPDIWKTIRVWSNGLSENRWNPSTVVLHLITTAFIPTNSEVAYLSNGHQRDIKKAHVALLGVANNSSNQALVSSFDAFKALSKVQQLSLLEAMFIFDQSPTIAELPLLIKKKIRWGIRSEHLDSVYERLEGWWFDKVVDRLLGNNGSEITQLDVIDKVHAINEQFKINSLPIDYENSEPDEEYILAQDERLFVHQLNLLKVNTQRIRQCISDYYKAFEQRARWVREDLLIDNELEEYEIRLVREWKRYVAILEDELSPVSDEDMIAFGKKMLLNFETVDIPIRKEMPLGHEYVMRGSYQILADLKPPRIYWHPKCLEKLDDLIAQLK
ncbi:ABC-three component system protein [Pontibacter pudoricolor]|uniref:ABC-three component system protein n=1 Tax=Pontibacter pudoricolor TaxID=2694930 RepID=UPI001391CA92|nr:ABC-three component system protein [Pontibacter pudoricolor]